MSSHPTHLMESPCESPCEKLTSKYHRGIKFCLLFPHKENEILALEPLEAHRPVPRHNIVTGKSGDDEGEVRADRRTVLGGRICNGRGGTSERHLETFSQVRVAPEKMFIVWGILLWY